MDAIFLGMQNLDFKPKDGDYIKGSKVFFAFPPETNQWIGLEVHSTFLDFERDRICIDCCKNLESLQSYNFDFTQTFSRKPRLKFVYPIDDSVKK